jgi:hypothetical protein
VIFLWSFSIFFILSLIFFLSLHYLEIELGKLFKFSFYGIFVILKKYSNIGLVFHSIENNLVYCLEQIENDRT